MPASVFAWWEAFHPYEVADQVRMVFDGVYVLNIKLDAADPWNCTRQVYQYVMAHRGKADVYFPVSTYDFGHSGIPSYVKATGLSAGEVAKRLLDMAREAGARGIVMECVDYGNYTPEICEALR